METMKNLLYSKSHEWLKVDGSQASIGITDHAQHALGIIVFIELPAVGADLAIGGVLGVTESVKAASDIYTPIAGRVVRTNPDLTDKPELINEHPYESWIAVLEMADPQQLATLMDEAAYLDYLAREQA
jgi:glycine cleavage system H protein